MPSNPQPQIPGLLIRRHPWLLCPISGILLALSFPKPSLFPLAWIGLVPYLLFLIARPSWKSLLAGHMLFSLTFFGGLLYWIPFLCGGFSALGALALWLLLALLQGLFSLPFTLLTGWAARHATISALICAPGFWLLSELLRSRLSWGGIPWGLVGHSQLPFVYWTQIADLGGALLVSYLTASISSLVVMRWCRGPRRPQAAFGAALILALGYGAYCIHLWQPLQTEPLTAALVQPAVSFNPPPDNARLHFETLAAAYQQASLLGADWVVFPPLQNPYRFGRDFYYTSFWRRLVRTYRTPLLLSIEESPQRPDKSVILLGPGGETAYRQDGIRPVPFVESPQRGSSPPGALAVGQVGRLHFSTLAGHEMLFAFPARQAVAQGAQALVSLSDDGCLGGTAAPLLFLEAARMRAIEVRRPVLQASNTGITARIDLWGRVGPRLPIFRQDLLLAEVRGTIGRSIYSIIGDWPSLLLVLVGPAASFGWPAMRRRISGMPARSRGSGAE